MDSFPPDHGGLYGPGETLTYAAQRLLTTHSLAREFPRSMISKAPFAQRYRRPQRRVQAPSGRRVPRLAARGRRHGATTRSRFLSPTFAACPFRSQITEVACEEGWSYIAEWIGAPLHECSSEAGVQPQARYIVYFSIEPDWWDSIDMADALHPQTFLTLGMNGGDLPVGFGGPLRLRVPRQLGYKSVKYITHLTVTDS